MQSLTNVFSNKLKTEWKATNQAVSGRCWMFAALNVLRQSMMEKYNLPPDFELSQSYLFFYDKLERANFFMHQIIDTADQEPSSREVMHCKCGSICLFI
jgi:bleomycin hydrolase